MLGALVSLSACGDRALSEDLEPRVQDHCDAWCPLLAECLPVGPEWMEEQNPGEWQRIIDACPAECVESRLDRMENPDLECELEFFERSECVSSKTGCEAFRAAYFMDGEPSESCFDEYTAEYECRGGQALALERWAEVPTP